MNEPGERTICPRCATSYRYGERHGCAYRTVQERIFELIVEERRFQDERFGGRSIGALNCPELKRLRTLVEEVGEVAEALDHEDANTKRDLERELVQTAACAVGWLEALYNRRERCTTCTFIAEEGWVGHGMSCMAGVCTCACHKEKR